MALLALALALLPLHDDAWWHAPARPRHAWWAVFTVLTYAGFCAWIWLRTRVRSPSAGVADQAGQDAILVAWASQTGFAHEIALRTSALLGDAGAASIALPLDRLGDGALPRYRRALFIVSTTGEGDPPDHALAFASNNMSRQLDLSTLEYAVLAIGDRSYAHYCSFGHQLDQWLHRCGARPLFDLTEVDNGEPGALRHWQQHVCLLCNATLQPDWVPPRYEAWTLASRTLVNPGSAGGGAFHLTLQPPATGAATWQAGDILEIGPSNAPKAVSAFLHALALAAETPIRDGDETRPLGDVVARARITDVAQFEGRSAQAVADALQPLPHREYSVASVPAEGPLSLLVRRMNRDDGTLGIGSGWLCDHAPIGTIIAARLRSNPGFHAPATTRPMILIGNGTGIAGLRAHIAARVAAAARDSWLLFGERNAGRDDFFADDIERWRRDGWLSRVDRAYSRDGIAHRYVQDALRAHLDVLCAWVENGAAIYVCGSLQGMAPAVDALLRGALGNAQVDAMLSDGRYRRDVY